jgi:hypothetical protein
MRVSISQTDRAPVAPPDMVAGRDAVTKFRWSDDNRRVLPAFSTVDQG